MSGDGWIHMPEDQPRMCGVCGQRIVTKDPEPVWFDTLNKTSSHFYCRVKR